MKIKHARMPIFFDHMLSSREMLLSVRGKGGLVVREGVEKDTPLTSELPTGAVVRVEEHSIASDGTARVRVAHLLNSMKRQERA